ncbi:hypothetical protein BABINDRAFT_166053 [Babjeviella inositovora NRRL Y-12698]|uniref:Uncharacterized protein n=1 Tax=Babjeviella inositovora NRRL Y-12698 TaxID=984486 RepID=A0A1E3QUJ8_9ASCO|nr:uncharacterized protein BABINDRAFT_166053 [Babjeviella inositovora NRRL Y-12698]ODQ81373.1 hypothetical protein BABINDRAFT_166053 [Babjeviella inositovora NRRL Y-12698]
MVYFCTADDDYRLYMAVDQHRPFAWAHLSKNYKEGIRLIARDLKAFRPIAGWVPQKVRSRIDYILKHHNESGVHSDADRRARTAVWEKLVLTIHIQETAFREMERNMAKRSSSPDEIMVKNESAEDMEVLCPQDAAEDEVAGSQTSNLTDNQASDLTDEEPPYVDATSDQPGVPQVSEGNQENPTKLRPESGGILEAKNDKAISRETMALHDDLPQAEIRSDKESSMEESLLKPLSVAAMGDYNLLLENVTGDILPISEGGERDLAVGKSSIPNKVTSMDAPNMATSRGREPPKESNGSDEADVSLKKRGNGEYTSRNNDEPYIPSSSLLYHESDTSKNNGHVIYETRGSPESTHNCNQSDRFFTMMQQMIDMNQRQAEQHTEMTRAIMRLNESSQQQSQKCIDQLVVILSAFQGSRKRKRLQKGK